MNMVVESGRSSAESIRERLQQQDTIRHDDGNSTASSSLVSGIMSRFAVRHDDARPLTLQSTLKSVRRSSSLPRRRSPSTPLTLLWAPVAVKKDSSTATMTTVEVELDASSCSPSPLLSVGNL